MAKTRKAKKVQKQKARAAKTAKSDDGGPPYKCRTTLEPGWCLKFTKDLKGRYNQPLGGTRVRCIECLYWFD